MKLLTISEAASVLRVSERRAYQLVRDGLLPGVHLGRQLRVEENALHQWVREGGQAFAGGWRRSPASTP